MSPLLRHPKAAAVVAFWTLLNIGLAAGHEAFGGSAKAVETGVFWGTVGLLILWVYAVARSDHRETRPKGAPVSGAPALAFAGACLAGALAWVFGPYFAYFAAPLLAYCAGRFRAERKARA